MGRSAGRKGTGRQDWIDGLMADLGLSAADRPQTEGERREEGIGDTRDIPGGDVARPHLANPEAEHAPGYSKPQEWEFRKLNAHGVDPDEAGHYERDGQHVSPRGGQSGKAELSGEKTLALPVAVYIVENPAGPRAKATAAFRRVTLPAAGSEPVTVSPSSTSRVLCQFLNEDSAHNCRIGNLEDLSYDYANSSYSGGVRLPFGATGYTMIRTKEQIFGVSETSNTVVISVILEDEITGAL